MADEAVVTIVARMQDEASPKMKQFGQTTEQVSRQALGAQVAIAAAGSAMAAMGGLAAKMDSPMAKMASNFLLTGGAILSTVSAIALALPAIRSLIAGLRNLAIAQAVVSAFQGPWGWAKLAAGGAIAASATAGIYALTGGFSGGGGGGAPGGTQVNVRSQVFTGSRADARKLGAEVIRISQSESRIGR
jgi:hypothetical protein